MGYICNDCKNELKTKIGVSFKKFMKTPVSKNVESDTREQWEQKVDAEFKFRAGFDSN